MKFKIITTQLINLSVNNGNFPEKTTNLELQTIILIDYYKKIS